MYMKITIVICDDEAIALKASSSNIEELARKYRIDANINSFTSGEKVIEFMENSDIDIAFLDIDLKGMNGITLASKILKRNPKVVTIFITAHREYALEAFNVEAFSYLTKPIDPERMERIFRKAILQVNDCNNRLQRVPLVITEDNIKRKISQSGIIYIERVGSQSIIVTKAGKHSVYETITSLAGRLEANFLQINQGIIVNLEEVAVIKGHLVTMKAGEVFSVGRTYSKDVKLRYLEYPRV